jgi:hypothetical protein
MFQPELIKTKNLSEILRKKNEEYQVEFFFEKKKNFLLFLNQTRMQFNQ